MLTGSSDRMRNRRIKGKGEGREEGRERQEEGVRTTGKDGRKAQWRAVSEEGPA